MASGGPDYDLEIPPGGLIVTSANPFDPILSASVAGDTVPRVVVRFDGEIKWSSGSAVSDVTLSRESATQLAIAGNLHVTENLFADHATTLKAGASSETVLTLVETSPQNAHPFSLQTSLLAELAFFDTDGSISAPRLYTRKGQTVILAAGTFDIALAANAGYLIICFAQSAASSSSVALALTDAVGITLQDLASGGFLAFSAVGLNARITNSSGGSLTANYSILRLY